MKNLALKITGITIFTLAATLLAFAIIRTIELI